MAKNIAANDKPHTSINWWYEGARKKYFRGVDLEDANQPKTDIDRCFSMAASGFWQTFVLGHPGAAYSLSICFHQGSGVKQDDYFAKLFFGVALKLNDPRCENFIKEIKVPKEMNQSIAEVVSLIKETQKIVNLEAELDSAQFIIQLRKFDACIKIPNSSADQTMITLFQDMDQDNQETYESYNDTNYQPYQEEEHAVELAGQDNSHHNPNKCIIS